MAFLEEGRTRGGVTAESAARRLEAAAVGVGLALLGAWYGLGKNKTQIHVITSYSIHYTKLYETTDTVSDCATGTGNSPPARKFAVSPERAIRFGSARVFRRRLSSSASR